MPVDSKRKRKRCCRSMSTPPNISGCLSCIFSSSGNRAMQISFWKSRATNLPSMRSSLGTGSWKEVFSWKQVISLCYQGNRQSEMRQSKNRQGNSNLHHRSSKCSAGQTSVFLTTVLRRQSSNTWRVFTGRVISKSTIMTAFWTGFRGSMGISHTFTTSRNRCVG